MASTGVPATDCLPPELLETILGFLDARTLCTARLVCAEFRGAASRCIHSVELSAETLRSRPETTLNSFPNLSRVSVFDVKEEDFVMLAQSPVADAVTHVRASAYFGRAPQRAQIAAGFPQQPLPNLMSLSVRFINGAPLFQQTLRELSIAHVIDPQTASLVAGLTSLTSLRIDDLSLPEPFQAVTALTALQRLEMCGDVGDVLSLIPSVAELTLLTHLHLQGCQSPVSLSDLAPLASLARLHRLVHLGVERFGGVLERHVLSRIATFTSLRSLVLDCASRPERSAFETVCMAPFSRLTALRLESYDMDAASFLLRLSLERLQDLRLSGGMQLDGDGVAALGRATGLTRLELWTATGGPHVGSREWERALSPMSRLCVLSLGAINASEATGPLQAVALLTALTRLDLSGAGVATNAAGEVCLGLKRLRVLSISAEYVPPPPSEHITLETFHALAKLPELCKFDIFGNVGVSDQGLTEDVRAQLNAERHAKGWPPLQLRVCAHKPLLTFFDV